MRSSMVKEKEIELAKERELAAMRLRDQIDRYDKSMLAQREKFSEELEAERQRLRSIHQSETAKLQKQVGSFMARDEDRYGEIRRQFQQQVDDAKRSGQQAVERQKEKERLERESWQTMMMRKLEADMRDDFERERDSEIDMVIERLGKESVSAQRDLEDRYQREMDDMRRRQERETSKYRQQNKELTEKYMRLSKETAAAEQRYNDLYSQ